ncbi:Hypothetical protein NTJ_05738 [Nesidiocoris tenuis]|uniref:Uncharacterized protein n=1 Tax=Nesidiocoris tenuis TaxID=355587 RepID=A0ABN7AL34_9HEMI|nr:Hypothetical protein NTJ_05738 [Nesidiocoris tenuis]
MGKIESLPRENLISEEGLVLSARTPTNSGFRPRGAFHCWHSREARARRPLVARLSGRRPKSEEYDGLGDQAYVFDLLLPLLTVHPYLF